MKNILAVLVLLVSGQAFGQNSFVNGLSHEGESITCDLPGSEHIKNIGSKIASRDGFGRRYYAGMCVFTSIEMAAIYSGLEQMRGYRDWVASHYEGGGWPDKVDETLDAYFKAKKISPIQYLQYQPNSKKDVAKILDLCEKSGRMAGMQYGFSPRYELPSIQHMANSVMFRGGHGVVLDNNFIGESSYEWVERDELLRRAIFPNKGAWIFVWLHCGPPPSPRNKKDVK